jgi:hypothetical protein
MEVFDLEKDNLALSSGIQMVKSALGLIPQNSRDWYLFHTQPLYGYGSEGIWMGSCVK